MQRRDAVCRLSMAAAPHGAANAVPPASTASAILAEVEALGARIGAVRARDRPRDLRPGRGGRSDPDHPALRRPRAAGRRARPGQEPAGGDAGRRAGPGHQARAVHPGPDAGRHHRQRGAGRDRRPAQLPLRARPGVLPVADGRRDQPRQPAHPVGAAAGDAGAARGGRRRRASRCRARSTCWRRRTRSSRRAPIRCRRRSSTGSCWRSTSAIPTWTPSATMLLATTGAAEARAGAGDDRRGTDGGAGADPPRAGGREGGGRDPGAGARRPAGDAPTTRRCAGTSPGARARAPRRR